MDAYAAALVPALIADAGNAAGWRYVEFFTANIRNPNTRRAYARACSRFFAWCDDRGLTLTTIRPHDVATYIETLQQTHSAPGVKQQLAAVRMLFDWLIVGQVAPSNPASAVRGPTHVVKSGNTPVLEGKEWRRLIDAIPTDTVRDLRDRALIATLTYGFARVGAALKMRVEDLQSKGSGWLIRLHEKGGKQHMMPCHHALAEALHAYIAAAGIAADRRDTVQERRLTPSKNCLRACAAGGQGYSLAFSSTAAKRPRFQRGSRPSCQTRLRLRAGFPSPAVALPLDTPCLADGHGSAAAATL
jgi:site-specific recombinase XerD